MNALLKSKKIYDRLEEYLVVAFVAATTLLIFYQVFMRYVFSASPGWSEEIARFMYVWESWLGISLTQKYSKHIKLEVLISKLTGKPLYWCNIAADVFTILICILLVVFGFAAMNQIFAMHQLSSATHIPMWIVYFACPFSCFLMIIRLLRDIKIQIHSIITGEVPETFDAIEEVVSGAVDNGEEKTIGKGMNE